MKKVFLLAGILIFISGIISAEGPEWPRFNGPNFDNISPDKGLLKEWPEDGPKQLWKYSELGVGFSSVSIAGGSVYSAGDKEGECFVTCLDSKGEMKWSTANGKAWTDKQYPGPRSTPTYNDGMVYHMNPHGRIAAYDAKSGKEVWAVDAAKEFGSKRPTWAFADSILIDGNSAVFYIGGKDGSLISLNKKTGKTVWANKEFSDAGSYCSAIIAEISGVRQYITMSAKNVVGFDTKNGALLWSYPYETNYDVHATPPVCKDNFVYVSSGYGVGGRCIKLTKAGSKFTADLAWSNKSLDNHHGGVVLLEGFIYGSGNKGMICLDFKTGGERYNEKGLGKGSVTYADGMLYLYGEGAGFVGIAKADPAGLSVISKFKMEKGGKSMFWAHPVVYDGKLYVRHDNNLCVYDVKGK